MNQKPQGRNTQPVASGRPEATSAEPGVLCRRHWLKRTSTALSATAFASLLQGEGLANDGQSNVRAEATGAGMPQAKRVIMLFQSGAPSQLDLLDPKPGLMEMQGKDLPDSIRKGQRLTGMTATQDQFPIAASRFKFLKSPHSGVEISELLPWTARIADRLCVVRSMFTDAINHDPAITFCQTGNQLAGRPSMGAWLSYGLGSMNENLPAFVAMVSGDGGQPLYDRLWGSGFLPTRYQGVKFRSTGDPVPFLASPSGIHQDARRRMINDLQLLNQKRLEEVGDPAIAARMSQYEMAFRMQSSVPEIVDVADESDATFDLYGEAARTPGTYARNCLLARRLLEKGVRFVQLFHRGWDQHRHLPEAIAKQCLDTDQASAALVRDLEQRGMLEDTIVVWCGEFGRTVYCQGALSLEDYGRDHHPRSFSIWMAGGGVRPGMTYGTTDDFSYNIVDNPVSVHDLHATLLHLLGIDHERLTFRFQGRDYRLTDVHGNVVEGLLA